MTLRLDHTSAKSMQVLTKQGLLKGAETCKLKFSEHYVLGKKTKVTFGTAIHHTKGIVDYVHRDVWSSLGGKHYFVSVVDDYTRRNWVYTMSHKSEVLSIFVE